MASTIVLCPRQHENLGGLSHCKACGLPLLDLPAEFESLAASLVSRAGMGRPSPRTVLIGLGTSGAGLVELARAAHAGPMSSYSYVAIDAKAADLENGAADVLRLSLGGSVPNAGTFCGIGQAIVKGDPLLVPVLRKAGFNRSNSEQTALVISALGGGIGSSASVIAEKCRQLNPDCHTLVLVIVPGTGESFHNRLNAYYGLSRLLDNSTRADLVVAVHFDRMKKIKGVCPSADELKTEGLLAALSHLMINNLSLQSISEVVRINRSMGVTLLVPCLALGRSLEIFGNLGNILQSAISLPANHIAKQAVLVCHLLLRVPESRAAGFSEEVVTEELGALIRRELPCVRGTSLSITYSTEQHDRVDACLLLGGDSAMTALFANGDAAAFEEELRGQVSWETYGLKETDMQNARSILAAYDQGLERAGGERRKQVLAGNSSTTSVGTGLPASNVPGGYPGTRDQTQTDPQPPARQDGGFRRNSRKHR